MITSLAIVMACHNRRAKTEACLQSLLANPEIADGRVRLHAYVCDDGSTDGTGEAITAVLGDRATVVRGNGNLFWNGGMVHAIRQLAPDRYDGVMLVNDDIRFAPDALQRFFADIALAETTTGKPCVLVGATVDDQGRTSYGGFLRGPWWNRMRLTRVGPGDGLTRIDSFNGNMVWLPRPVATAVTILDPVFIHSMGDIDLGFRLRRRGVPIFLCPGHMAQCNNNVPRKDGNAWTRLKRSLLAKNFPLRQWLVLSWRHAGPCWPIVFLLPYVNALRNRA